MVTNSAKGFHHAKMQAKNPYEPLSNQSRILISTQTMNITIAQWHQTVNDQHKVRSLTLRMNLFFSSFEVKLKAEAGSYLQLEVKQQVKPLDLKNQNSNLYFQDLSTTVYLEYLLKLLTTLIHKELLKAQCVRLWVDSM